MTAPWTRPQPLPNKPQWETNLLPRSAWSDPANPLRVQLKPWYDSPIDEDGTESVKVFLDDNESIIIGTRSWVLPMEADDHYVEITADKLPQGEHRISFIMSNFQGVDALSFPYTVTIDKEAPQLEPGSKLIFPSDVLPPNKLTAHYLEGDDLLIADIPAYSLPKPGDVITWYWDKSPSGTTIGGTKTLSEHDYDKPLTLAIDGDWIRSQGDDDRYVWYTVTDRAGNLNGQSAVERLIVEATPIPRDLPPPKVVEAGGTTWPVRGTLNPLDATNGVIVILNPASVIHPGEVPQVQWALKGALGGYLADPVSPGLQEYRIPKEYMAPHFGKVIPVVYLFKDKFGAEHSSRPYSLTVSNYPNDRLPTPQIAEGSPLSLAQVPPTGASITLGKWPFSAAGQRITILVEGTEDAGGRTIKCDVLVGHEVTADQAIAGIAKGEALVAKADFLSRIRLGSTLNVKVYVSFDNSQTPPNPSVMQFPWFKPKVNP
jgi:hypothetical protein